MKTTECPACGEAHDGYTGKFNKEENEYVVCGSSFVTMPARTHPGRIYPKISYPDIILEALERCASIDLESARCYRMEADYCQGTMQSGSVDHIKSAEKLERKAELYRAAMKHPNMKHELKIGRELRKDDYVFSLEEFFNDLEFGNWDMTYDWLCWANDTHKFYNFVPEDIKRGDPIPEGVTQVYFAPQ